MSSIKRLRLPAYIFLFSLTALLISFFAISPEKVNPFLITSVMTIDLVALSFVPSGLSARQRWLVLILAKLIAVAFIVYAVINVLNVYSFAANPNVQRICATNTQACSAVSSIFFSFKLFRFITLPPKLFIYLEFLFLGLYLVDNHRGTCKRFVKAVAKKPLVFLATVLTMIMLCTQLFNTFDRIYDLSLKTWNNRNLAFLDRFVPYEFGIEHHGWIWEYGKFLAKHVPESAVIFIPPQNDIWPQEGNKYYFRWFLYPRDLVQSEQWQAPIPDDAQFIIISRGGWNGGLAGWPKKAVLPDCIESMHLIDRYTLAERTVDPAGSQQSLLASEWGVIKLKQQKNKVCLN